MALAMKEPRQRCHGIVRPLSALPMQCMMHQCLAGMMPDERSVSLQCILAAAGSTLPNLSVSISSCAVLLGPKVSARCSGPASSIICRATEYTVLTITTQRLDPARHPSLLLLLQANGPQVADTVCRLHHCIVPLLLSSEACISLIHVLQCYLLNFRHRACLGLPAQ